MHRIVENGEKYKHNFSVRETRRINDVRDLMCREYILGCHEMLKHTECLVIVNYILACHKTLSYIREILNYIAVCNKILNLVQFTSPMSKYFENHCCKR
jgi:uncharacterized protein YpiB (UPF0302 family)